MVLLVVLTGNARSQCPPNAFAFTSTYPQCTEGCGVLLRDWPEGVIVNIYGGTPLTIVTSVLIPGTYGGPGTGNAFVCVPCGIPLVFASAIPGATSGCVITYLGTVAVTLTDFSVNPMPNGINRIQWTSAADSRDVIYSVQKSTNGTTFSDIAAIPAQGGTGHQYRFDDAAYNRVNTQYRIKMQEASGQISYSKTILSKVTQLGNSLSIYPNPASGSFNIACAADLLPARVQLLNAQGQIVYQFTSTTPVSTVQQTLPKGIYAVKLTGRNNEQLTQTLIKN